MRILEKWDGFTYQVVGTAPTLAAAREWLGLGPAQDELANDAGVSGAGEAS